MGAALAELCSPSPADKPHLVYQHQHMLYTHRAAGALQAEISVPAGEITEEKVEEQRLEQRFFKENAKAVLNRGSKAAGEVHV